MVGEIDVDYVTVAPASKPFKFCALIMHYQSFTDDYVATRCSEPLSESAARHLAEAWAAALRLDYRP